MAEVLFEVMRQNAPNWLRDLYLDKLRLRLAGGFPFRLEGDLATHAEAYTQIANKNPESRPVLREAAQSLSQHPWRYERVQDKQQRQAIDKLYRALDLPPPVREEPDTEKPIDSAAESQPTGEAPPDLEPHTE